MLRLRRPGSRLGLDALRLGLRLLATGFVSARLFSSWTLAATAALRGASRLVAKAGLASRLIASRPVGRSSPGPALAPASAVSPRPA